MYTIKILVLGTATAATALVLAATVAAQAKPLPWPNLGRYIYIAHVKPGDPVEFKARFSRFGAVMLNPQPLPPRYRSFWR